MNFSLIDEREKKKISPSELAGCLGISLSMVYKVEKGVRRASPSLAKKWANKLGIKEKYIFKYFFSDNPDNMSSKVKTG